MEDHKHFPMVIINIFINIVNLVTISVDVELLIFLLENWFWKLLVLINPFAPGDFAEKSILKLVEWFSGHCVMLWRAKTYHKPVYRSYFSRPSDTADAKYQLAQFEHAV